jgi:hypothetical protein
MTYIVTATSPISNLQSDRKIVDTLQHARDVATEVVHVRMEAFGEDREALNQYGYFRAEAEALDMLEDGGTILLPDGWKIVITNNEETA